MQLRGSGASGRETNRALWRRLRERIREHGELSFRDPQNHMMENGPRDGKQSEHGQEAYYAALYTDPADALPDDPPFGC